MKTNQSKQTTRTNLLAYLPTTKKELELRGWDQPDVIIYSGDAYIDHPAFGTAVIGRVLEAAGLKVAIIPQPDWHGDLRDFTRLGKPKLFAAITAGAMDSMLNHYTANKRRRSDDAYSPNAQRGLRPDRATIVYSKILKQLYPDLPIVIGGIEASMRRFSHYDYWDNTLMPSILYDTQADLLVYGMGEKTMQKIAETLKSGGSIQQCQSLPQVGYISNTHPANAYALHPYLDCLKDKHKSAQNFRKIEEESNTYSTTILYQQHHNHYVILNPPEPALTTPELDAIYALPYTRYPHPKYANKRLPAYDMIKHSVTTHRGCFGGCSFCTISLHQGKTIISRSIDSIKQEVLQIIKMDDFKGYISDLGGPSANMYGMAAHDTSRCAKCKRPSCAYPTICRNMNTSHNILLYLYDTLKPIKKLKKTFVSSGLRYDLMLHQTGDPITDNINQQYIRELIANHVSGRLKVAPEHSSDSVLQLIRKPSFKYFQDFKLIFDKICQREGLKQFLVPYFISCHPGCSIQDMAALALEVKALDFHPEQVQAFTPTPMTLSTEMYFAGINPYTNTKIQSAKTSQEKQDQHIFFFWHKPENYQRIRQLLFNAGKSNWINQLLFGKRKQ